MEQQIEGLVLKSLGKNNIVLLNDGSTVEATVKGKLRMKNLRTTNPVAVGDNVILSLMEGDYRISSILPRENYLIRKSVNLSKEAHIIGANIDTVFVVATLKEPETLPLFVDRILLTCTAYHVQAKVIFNKVDLLEEEELEMIRGWQAILATANYESIELSCKTGEGLDELRAMCKDKTVLFAGNSGVGKSSIVKELDPDVDIAIGAISEMHEQGKHTTTFAEMFLLKDGIRLIDSPGIRGFGLVHLERDELKNYMPDFAEAQAQCKFNNCLHLVEPGCMVREYVEEGKISDMRYEHYLQMMDAMEEDTYRKNIYGA